MLKNNRRREEKSVITPINKLTKTTFSKNSQPSTSRPINDRPFHLLQQNEDSKKGPRILKISELINKTNICALKQINLLTTSKQATRTTSRKKKLQVSLSKQNMMKERSVSQKSINRSTKLKISIIKQQSMRKIKSFNVEEQQENIRRTKSPRFIQDLHSLQNMKDLMNRKQNSTNLMKTDYDSNYQSEKRIIKLIRNK